MGGGSPVKLKSPRITLLPFDLVVHIRLGNPACRTDFKQALESTSLDTSWLTAAVLEITSMLRSITSSGNRRTAVQPAPGSQSIGRFGFNVEQQTLLPWATSLHDNQVDSIVTADRPRSFFKASEQVEGFQTNGRFIYKPSKIMSSGRRLILRILPRQSHDRGNDITSAYLKISFCFNGRLYALPDSTVDRLIIKSLAYKARPSTPYWMSQLPAEEILQERLVLTFTMLRKVGPNKWTYNMTAKV